MLVSHKHKFIYIKSIKTAGTSTEIFLEPYCIEDIKESHGRKMIKTDEGIVGSRLQQRNAERYEFYNHMPPKLIKDKIGEETFNSYTKIINIRNPFDMMVSHYYFKPTFKLYSDVEMSFSDYMLKTNVVEDLADKYKNLMFIDDIFVIDEIIRFEKLESDLENLIKKLNLPTNIRTLGTYKKNTNKKTDSYKELHNDEIINLVCTHFKFYMELFNYKY
jgi:hypothetical protein